MILNTLKCVTKSNYKGFLFKKYLHVYIKSISLGHHAGNTFLPLFQCQNAAPWPIVADKRSPTILCILATGHTLLLLETEF